MTWVFPGSQGTPVRPFTSNDVPSLAERLSQGKRDQFLSLLSLLRGAARKESSTVQSATKKLNLSSVSIFQEEEQARRDLAIAIQAQIKFASGPTLSPEENIVLDELRERGVRAREEIESQFEGTTDTVQARSMELSVSSEAMQQMAASLWEPITPTMPLISPNANPTRIVSATLTSVMRGARLVLWEARGRLRPALYCGSDEFLAAYVFTLVGGESGWAVCPGCNKLFKQGKRVKKWHTSACGNAFRSRKSQARKRAKSRDVS